MIHSNKRLALGVEEEDRLSNLPRNIVDQILSLMPTEDAARTSVLAKKWRDIWNKHPNIILDKLTFKKISTIYKFNFHEKIDEILQRHAENILKFVFECSDTRYLLFSEVDRWINFVIGRDVRELTIHFPNRVTYKLPSNLYSYQHLTNLSLSNCSFKPSNFIFFYPNLKTLYLNQITFMTGDTNYILKSPVLTNLTIKCCSGIELLDIISPQLIYLVGVDSRYLKLICFTNCATLSVVSLSLSKVLENPTQNERSTLLQFILGLPMLNKLYLDTFYIQFLGEAPVVSRVAPVVQNCLRHIMLSIQLTNPIQVSFALLFIQCFFNLKTLQIWVLDTCHMAEDVLNYLEAPHNFDRLSIFNLEQVVIHHFNGTKSELQLIKLLLGATPNLHRMQIEKERVFTLIQEKNITAELMRYPRASSKAELIYL